MQRIVPHLWYDTQAKEAASFYVRLFDQSEIFNVSVIENTPSGDAETVSFQLAGVKFEAISAGPYFKFNPSASFLVFCNNEKELRTIWEALSEDGIELMPLGEYPFSNLYVWVQDKYGLSWQLLLSNTMQRNQKVIPNLLFSGKSCGMAEEAVKYYVEVFSGSEILEINNYKDGEAQAQQAKVNYASFELDGLALSAMDNAFDVDYEFNEAVSFIVKCRDQEEIDYFWDKLSFVPEAEQCGWIKDRFGVSWQIVPIQLDEMMNSGDRAKVNRVTQEVLAMKKLELDILLRAFDS